jgi:hypothetical protein
MLFQKLLSNARHAFETREMRKARKAKLDELVSLKLRGTFAHISSRCLTLPAAGVDVKIDHAIVNQQIRDVTEMKMVATRNRFGQPVAFDYVRVGREKGTTYEHWSKVQHPGLKRAERRALWHYKWRTTPAAGLRGMEFA